MSCPTCDHTMQKIGEDRGDSVFWCPRCGTWKIDEWGGFNPATAPELVSRCREFETCPGGLGRMDLKSLYVSTWHRLGIAESINKPEDRK